MSERHPIPGRGTPTRRAPSRRSTRRACARSRRAQLTLPDGGRPALTAGGTPARRTDPRRRRSAAAAPRPRARRRRDDARAGTELDAPGAAATRLPARATPARGGRQERNRNAPRFQFLFGALGALSVAAVALTIALLRAPAPAPERPWSGWKPAPTAAIRRRRSPAYVAPLYRLDDGKQIVQVSGGPPTVKGQPLTLGVVRSGQTPAALEGNNVLYQLCGDGTDCSIKAGKPSTERALLLAREALELALYTFRYVSGANQVVVTIPPPPPSGASKTSAAKLTSTGAAPAPRASARRRARAPTRRRRDTVSHALLFTQADLAAALDQPLSATLSAVTPQVSQMDGWPDASTVKALTEPHLYDFTISETQQTGAVMLLRAAGPRRLSRSNRLGALLASARLVAAAAQHRQARVARIGGILARAQTEREARAARVADLLAEAARRAQTRVRGSRRG